tara:strand:+ start:412 stop:867 length:456 start_codon:yes stop_codon:yes gene_type:complete
MIIKDIKQKLNIFKREQVTSINWPDVIDESEIECAINENVVDCEGEAFKQDALNYYTGVPAPVYLEDDEWFGPAPIRSQKQIDYMEKEIEMKRQERKESFSVEPDDIHQKMYEIVTKNHNTTLDLDPPGGSENFHTGPGDWNSGNGREQFL